MTAGISPQTLEQLRRSIVEADRVLIVAAAGLSISTKLPNNPYHSDADFALHYPRVSKEYGYRNAYQAMGISMDPDVPPAVKSAFGAHHWLNMTENFPPTEGYAALRNLTREARCRESEHSSDDHVFCWTSNVDQCFSRSGFSPDRVYTSQGEMDKLQCLRCSLIWKCTENLHRIVASSGSKEEMELSDLSLANKCPKCSKSDQVMPNLRGGDWFDHSPYLPQQESLIDFLTQAVQCQPTAGEQGTGSKLTVIEVGVGPNTPVVTALPASKFAIAAALNGAQVSYIRINPDARCEQYSGNPEQAFGMHRQNLDETEQQDNAAGGDLKYSCLNTTWEILLQIAEAKSMGSEDSAAGSPELAATAPPSEMNPKAKAMYHSAVKMLYNLR